MVTRLLLNLPRFLHGNLCAPIFLALIGLLVSRAQAATAGEDESADMIIFGRIWTADRKQPSAEAIATRGEKIIAVGKRDDVSKYRGERTRVIDAGSGMVVPGLIDSHIHLIDGGL